MPSTELRASISLFLCIVLMAALPDVRTAPAGSVQTPIESLDVPELDAGFHLLYELKPEEARKQFESLQRFHPEDPLVALRKRQHICLRSAIGRAS
jgi:hypothetical protein